MSTTTSAIPVRERLIVALDVPGFDDAKSLVQRLDDSVEFYKIGLELATSPDYFRLLGWLQDQGKRVFADLKLYDIPATVAAAVKQMSKSGADFLTVHGERSVMQAAAEAKGDRLKILAVTVLTSISQEDLTASGVGLSLDALALSRAEQAVAAGVDGVIASGLEARKLRQQLGTGPLIVTPGIRPEHHAGGDDQKRIVTAATALANGADYIVVGRPIRAAQDPYAAATQLQSEIAACYL